MCTDLVLPPPPQVRLCLLVVYGESHYHLYPRWWIPQSCSCWTQKEILSYRWRILPKLLYLIGFNQGSALHKKSTHTYSTYKMWNDYYMYLHVASSRRLWVFQAIAILNFSAYTSYFYLPCFYSSCDSSAQPAIHQLRQTSETREVINFHTEFIITELIIVCGQLSISA